MKKVVIGILAVVGFLSICAVFFVACIGILASFGTESLPANIILEVDFERGVIESVPDDPFAQLMMEDVLELRDVVEALQRAAEDRRVKMVVARIGAGGLGLAHTQEVRDAVARFRESGKPAIAYAETFGEFGPGNGGYYLATAFEKIYLQPSGDVGMTGIMYESEFVRGTLDKLDIEPQMGQRHEYKSAMNYYTEQAYTEAQREAMQELMESQFRQLVRGIAEGRNLSEEQVVALFDRGPFLAQEALEAMLIDELAYHDELEDMIRETAGKRAEEVGPQAYLRGAGRPNRRGETIALIHAYGTVMRGKSGYSPLNGSVTVGSESVAGALRDAIDDDRVKAIVLRVDSPGGSYVASDTIWRETVRAREAGKPVVVSMGNLAASGGYFVSMDADHIVAQPGTITASIGVLGGKLVTRGLWEKLGFGFDSVQSSANSNMWSGVQGFNERGFERLDAGLDRIYEDFTSKVAAGRELPIEEVQRIARGRIWTGEDALALGLVDELGGVEVALRRAREAAGLDPDAAIRLKRLPRRKTALELILEQRGFEQRAVMGALVQALRVVQPKVRMLQRLEGAGASGLLTTPDAVHGD